MTALNSRKVFGGDKDPPPGYHWRANTRPRLDKRGGTGCDPWRGQR